MWSPSATGLRSKRASWSFPAATAAPPPPCPRRPCGAPVERRRIRWSQMAALPSRRYAMVHGPDARPCLEVEAPREPPFALGKDAFHQRSDCARQEFGNADRTRLYQVHAQQTCRFRDISRHGLRATAWFSMRAIGLLWWSAGRFPSAPGCGTGIRPQSSANAGTARGWPPGNPCSRRNRRLLPGKQPGPAARPGPRWTRCWRSSSSQPCCPLRRLPPIPKNQ